MSVVVALGLVLTFAGAADAKVIVHEPLYSDLHPGTTGFPGPSVTVTEYSLPIASSLQPDGMVAGPDGRLWFTANGHNAGPPVAGVVGASTTAGQITIYPVPGAAAYPQGITTGSDGRLWFADAAGQTIDAMTTTGTVTAYPIPGDFGSPCSTTGGVDYAYCAIFVARGADGRIWFSNCQSGDKIGAMTTSGVVSEYAIPGSELCAITLGHDGRVWGIDGGNGSVDAIDTSGNASIYPLARSSYYTSDGIAGGPDGRTWVITDGGVVAVTAAGHMTRYRYSDPNLRDEAFSAPLVAGGDGKIWIGALGGFTDVTTAGHFDPNGDYSIAGYSVGAHSMAPGADGRMWFMDPLEGAIGVFALPHVAGTRCLVPRLTGLTLAQARVRLTRGHCRLGRVTKKRAKGRAGRVLSQSPKPGAKRGAGTLVAVTLSKKG